MNRENESERRADSACYILELSGKTWYLPCEMLEAIPRVGEDIQVDGYRGRVTDIEYEFDPIGPPLRMGGEEMPGGRSYAKPVRIIIRASGSTT